jgi:hypothetical protein
MFTHLQCNYDFVNWRRIRQEIDHLIIFINMKYFVLMTLAWHDEEHIVVY